MGITHRQIDPALQPTLFAPLPPVVQPDMPSGATIQERFEAFHGANPHVYAALRRMALDMAGRGVRRYGMKGLFEVLRWQFAMQTQGDAEFKLNNNYTAHYSRLLMANEPRLADFFVLRELQAA